MMKRIILSLAALPLLIGCQDSFVRSDDTADDIKAAFESEAQKPETTSPLEAPKPPPAVTQSLLPPVKIDLTPIEDEQRFDISVREIEAHDFFMGLVANTPQNMVVHPSVSGKISLTLKDVTTAEVMDTIRRVYGYEYEINATGYLVLPRRLHTRTFHIDYLDLQRVGVSQTWVSSGQLTQQDHDGSSGEDSNTPLTGDKGKPESSSDSGVATSTGIRTTTKSDFWGGLEATLAALIENSDNGSVVLNRQASLAIVRAYPEDLRAVENFLGIMHENLNRQVVLEAKIVEVILNDGYQSGINWAKLGRLDHDKPIFVGQTGGGSYFNTDPNRSEIAGADVLLEPYNLDPITGTMTSAFGGVFTASLALGSFTAFIELLESQGSVQVLSSPRISTLNNQKAVIKVGTDEYFVTELSNSQTAVAGSGVVENNPTVILTPFFEGIALDVTPHIDESNEIILHIHPSISEVNDQTKQLIVGNEQISLPLALSNVRESDSIIKAMNGQVVVIGGLMENYSQTDTAGVPVLGDLPVIGGAFHHDRQAQRKTELVILLRPLVTNSREVNSRYVRESAERVRLLQDNLLLLDKNHVESHGSPLKPPQDNQQ